MAARRSGSGRGPNGIVLLAALLVAFVLGHDILMAAGADGAHRHATETESPRVRGDVHASIDPDGSETPHPEQCGIGQPGVARRIDDADPPDRSALEPAWREWAGASRWAVSAPPTWTEPRWPARTRRALWQVYRL